MTKKPEWHRRRILATPLVLVVPSMRALEARAGELLRYGKTLPAPPTGRWQFKVYYGDYVSGIEVALLDYAIEFEGARYRVYTEGRATGVTSLLYSGLLTQSSTGRFGANGLIPERYTERRGSRAPRDVLLDYRSRTVEFSGKGTAPLRDGVQDRLSALIQLGLIARAAPELVARGASVEIAEASGSQLETVAYRSMGVTSLATERGSIRAIHLERVRSDGEGHARAEVWLGYDRELIPVRIRITNRRGHTLDQVISN